MIDLAAMTRDEIAAHNKALDLAATEVARVLVTRPALTKAAKQAIEAHKIEEWRS